MARRRPAYLRARTAAAPAPRDSNPRALRVLFASATLLAVDKPQGLLVHGDGTGNTTLTDLVRAELGELLLPGIVDSARAAQDLQALQRLDIDTSGIVLFSLAKETQPLYDRLIAERAIDKRYLALVAGCPPWDAQVLDAPIGRDRHDARRVRVSATGKPARTEARVIWRGNLDGCPVTLLDVHLCTGRKHQIRVHLSSSGFPLVGDTLYGTPNVRGLMLHAYRMAFMDPVTHEPVTINAPAPPRFTRVSPDLMKVLIIR